MNGINDHGASVAIWTDPERCVPFMKGRVALYAILRALGIGEGDEVLVPGFTCFVVPAAVVYTGATPVFYDIDRRTLQGDPVQAVDSITDRTGAVLVQHNFGEIAPYRSLLRRCTESGIPMIEDCAHAMGATSPDGPAGTLGAAAFSSLQWSKPTTTGLGGIARLNDDALARETRHVSETECSEPSRLVCGYLHALSEVYRRWYRSSWYWHAQGFYRWVSTRGLVRGSSTPEEFTSGEMPEGYLQRFGSARRSSLEAALGGLPALLAHRRNIYGVYVQSFASGTIWPTPKDPTESGSAALRFPLLVENRGTLLRESRERRLEMGDWFNAPLHPREADAAVFGYRPGLCPKADWAAARIVNLPTHRGIDPEGARRIADFVGEHAIPARI